MSKSLARQILLSTTQEPKPFPGIWDWFWDTVPFLRAGKPGDPVTAGDVERVDFQALFLGIKAYFDRYGSVFKMCFGPKSFLVVSDPVVARHVLRDNSRGYDKGALSLVLEDIMGKGLIPADLETWKKRRRAIAPGFHKLYLARMVDEFGG